MENLEKKHWSVLKSNPLFQDLDERSCRQALQFFQAKSRSYTKGATLHKGGTPFLLFGLVLEGIAQVCRDELDGRRLLMAHVSPGETFGESLCFLQQISPVYVFAQEKTVVLWLSVEGIRSSSDMGSPYRNRFIAMLAQRTLWMNNRIQILSKPSLRDKLMTFFTQCMPGKEEGTFSIPFDRAGMASYLGADRSAVSRELSKMKQEGLLDYYRNSFRLFKNGNT